MGTTHAVLVRILSVVAVALATTINEPVFGARDAKGGTARPAILGAVSVEPPAADAAEVVLSFGDALGELHAAVSYDEADRDLVRVARACGAVVSAYPLVREAVGDKGTDLLVAAESMVDACRRGFAARLDVGAFEIVDGDYYTYRELSLAFGD